MPRGREYVVIGEVLKPHGVRGELGLMSFAETDEHFSKGRTIRLRPAGSKATPRDYVIVGRRVHRDRLLLTLQGVDDRTAAEALRGHEALLPAGELLDDRDDDVYLFELEGMRVILPDGSELGCIVDAQVVGGQELWMVETAEGKDVLLPAVDEFILGFDEAANAVKYDPPDGLLAIYLNTEG